MATTPLFSQLKKTFLKQPVISTDTSILVGALVDCYGNAVTTAQTGNPFYFTISPGGSDEEICSATTITQNADGTATISGLTRGLAAVTSYGSGGNALSHGASTPVVFMPDNPQLLNSIIAYVNSLVLAAAVQATDATVGYVNTSVAPVSNAFSRVQSVLVSQQGTPNTTVYVQPFATVGLNVNMQFAGGNSPAIANPTTNPRIDLVVYATGSSSVLIRQGTENASITTANWATYAPSPLSGDIVLCAIFNRHVSGSVQVKDRDDATNAFIIRWYETGLYTSITLLSTNSLLTDIDQSQTTENGTQGVGLVAGTNNAVLAAQSFIPTVNNIRGFSLWKIADTGTFTGTVTVSLQADSGGSPSGSNLGASNAISNAEWLLIGAGEFTVQFTTPYSSLIPGSSYWIVVTTSTTDSSNYPNLGINTAGGYASGALQYYNGTIWKPVSTSILYFKTRGAAAAKIIQTGSDGLIPAIGSRYAFIAADATSASTTNGDGADHVIFSQVIDPSLWSANSGFKFTLDIAGWAGNTGGGSNETEVAVKIKYAGNSFLSIPIANESASAYASNRKWLTVIIKNNGALNSQITAYYGFQAGGTSNTQPSDPTAPVAITVSTAAVDTSLAGVLEIAGNITTTGGYITSSVTYNGCIIEKIA